jgi:hypothetical protein
MLIPNITTIHSGTQNALTNIQEVMQMRQVKLISGNMNVPYTICKPGYALGSNKPKRVKKTKPFNPVIKLRKMEYSNAA